MLSKLSTLSKLSKFSRFIHPLAIRMLGRDRLEYLASNTTNEVTRRIDPFIWSYSCKAKVVAIHQETPDTKTFVLLPNQHFKTPLSGQHIEITLDGDYVSEPVSRCYTLSEINQDTVSITVKLSPEGQVSGWLHNNARVGMIFNISSPRGRFVYREQDKLLFISAGSGITPAYSMINTLLGKAYAPKIGLFYRTKTPVNTIFYRKLAEFDSRVKVNLSYSQTGNSATAKVSVVDQLSQAYPDIKQRHIYLCGPESFRNDVLQYLETIGYDMNMLEIEQFTMADTAAQQGEKINQDVSVRLISQNIDFVIPAIDNHKTILQAAEDQGIHLEHGCRSGMCGSCKTQLVSGKVSGNQLGKSIYPCSSYPASRELVLE